MCAKALFFISSDNDEEDENDNAEEKKGEGVASMKVVQ